MARSADSMFGRRNRIAQSSPWATAPSAGISQLPRWLAKMIAGLPSSRSVVENFLGPRAELDAARLVRMIEVVVPDVIEMGEFGADAAEIVPDAGQDGLDLLRAISRGKRP